MGTWTPGPGATGGNDIYIGDASDETVDGLGGDDTLSGGDGADELIGGAGADTLYGGALAGLVVVDDGGVDTLTGGDGDDHLIGGLEDVFRGGAGSNRATLTFAANVDGVVLNLLDLFTFTGANALALPGGGSISDVNQVIVLGGAGGDDITLNAAGLGGIVRGGDGNDTIRAGGGIELAREIWTRG
jgi:Ca2+-binding RTX toxin-like protein